MFLFLLTSGNTHSRPAAIAIHNGLLSCMRKGQPRGRGGGAGGIVVMFRLPSGEVELDYGLFELCQDVTWLPATFGSSVQVA